MKNFFLTGPPSSGKTSAIKKIIAELSFPASGFYTEEERIEGKRVGFIMHTLSGESGYLAHEDIESEFHIRRFGVSIENIERIAVPSIRPLDNHIIILDEIGKMECFSERFIQAAREALDSSNIVIGTITLGGSGFILEVKERSDVKIIELTDQNREHLPGEVLNLVEQLIIH
ncbi:MAG: nucleoside-triphosphatase [Chlamydiales bacterium]